MVLHGGGMRTSCASVFRSARRPQSLPQQPRLRPRLRPRPPCPRRFLVTLAIETSCDDTSVAVLEKGDQAGFTVAKLHFHDKITSNSTSFGGVHPLVSHGSHQENLANLVRDAVDRLPTRSNGTQQPDFVSVTRGPGMRSNLSAGLDTAKGLAVAWRVPLVGVHHMQAHALTPRLVNALENYSGQYTTGPTQTPSSLAPDFPFLSVLASGGHTLITQSTSLTDHQMLATTTDIAIGECLDKVARVVLPAQVLQSSKTTMYGALLEQFAFSGAHPDVADSQSLAGQDLERAQENNTAKSSRGTNSWLTSGSKVPGDGSNHLFHITSSNYCDNHPELGQLYDYVVPKNNEEARKRSTTRWGWGFTQPLTSASGGIKIRSLEMSFSGLTTAAERAIRYRTDPISGKLTKEERSAEHISIAERRTMAREAMRAVFEHVAGRVVLALQQTSSPSVVLAGGVASNRYMRYILASTLCAHGYPNVALYFPPPTYCTDNAAMIAWTGIEMFEAGHTDPFSIRAIRKWPLHALLSPPADH